MHRFEPRGRQADETHEYNAAFQRGLTDAMERIGRREFYGGDAYERGYVFGLQRLAEIEANNPRGYAL